MLKIHLILLHLLLITIKSNLASPQSLVVSTSTAPPTTEISKKETPLENGGSQTAPEIYQMQVKSAVNNRYANTTITSKVRNTANESREVVFAVVIPETAFISGLIMEVDGKNYTAYVREKEEAKKTYEEAVASGLGAAHVAVSARDSNRFVVSVNVESEHKAAFYLTYEELLKRQDDHYELVINLHPGQPVKDLNVEVVISESRKLVNLKTPPIRSGNEIGNEKLDLDPRADVQVINDTAAVVKFTPNVEKQKQFAKLLNTNENEGLAGQFVVQYDVERDPKGGEVLVQDGYFVHFFAPTEVQPLPKHVVFILDTSYSMYGQKIEQLREAMMKILGELKGNDLFSIVEFSNSAKVWDLDNSNKSTYYPDNEENYWRVREETESPDISNYTFPDAYPANGENIQKAKATVSHLEPNGGTNIYVALKVGLHLIQLVKSGAKDEKSNPQPIMIFLTDGDPTSGITSTEEIVSKITKSNTGSVPIFALSFGEEADKKFLQKLSLLNFGFSRHIYEAADASLQLQEFYKQISSPLLANVTFKYEPSVTSLTKTEFPIHFGGSELVIAGWCGTVDVNPTVNGWGVDGNVHFKPTTDRSVSNIERLWAYLTIKQLLDKKEVSDEDKEGLKKKALDLSLKYSFVTPLTSLVVVKPNDTSMIDTATAEKRRFLPYAQSLAGAAGVPLSGSSGFVAFHKAAHSYSPQFAVEAEDSVVDNFAANFYPTTHLVPTIEATTNYDSDIFSRIPWLRDALSENQTLMLPAGEYKLGLNLTSPMTNNGTDCPKTPTNSTGHCTLLESCQSVHSLLTSIDVFVEYFCAYETEYVGVCCPK